MNQILPVHTHHAPSHYHTFGRCRVATMGDPHLGRRFVSGVPLHRRGEREESVWRDFRASLTDPTELDVHVCMGDLFDRAVVPYDVVLRAARAYWQAAEAFPDRTYVVLKGNHDVGGDLAATTAFDVFKALVARKPNIMVVDHQPRGLITAAGAMLAFCPWDKTDQIEGMGGDAIFGHWDIHDFGSSRNVVPTRAVSGRFPVAVTGHDHTPQTLERDGVTVIGTGSLQPFTHGEDPHGVLYRTMTLAELLELGDGARDLCVRVLLEQGETLPADIDCLQLTAMRRGSEVEAEPVDLAALDIAALWKDAMAAHGVDDELSGLLFDKYRAREAA